MSESVDTAGAAAGRETAAKRRRELHAEMRAKGYKRVVRWVPDISNPIFMEQYRRQLEVIAEHHRQLGTKDYLPAEEDVRGWS